MESKPGYTAKENLLQNGFLIYILYVSQAFPTFRNAFNLSKLTNFTIGAKGDDLCKKYIPSFILYLS